jgi:hypothetical protein
MFVVSGPLVRREGSPTIGEVWIFVGKVAFPAVGWTDFSFCVLGAWAWALRRLIAGSRSERVFFMEGPYEVELRRRAGWVFLYARKGTLRGRRLVRRIRLPMRRFANALLRAVESALSLGAEAGEASNEYLVTKGDLPNLRRDCRRLLRSSRTTRASRADSFVEFPE